MRTELARGCHLVSGRRRGSLVSDVLEEAAMSLRSLVPSRSCKTGCLQRLSKHGVMGFSRWISPATLTVQCSHLPPTTLSASPKYSAKANA
jgi:hypothetical protein